MLRFRTVAASCRPTLQRLHEILIDATHDQAGHDTPGESTDTL